jgi:methyl-accepting chemotaxis protein
LALAFGTCLALSGWVALTGIAGINDMKRHMDKVTDESMSNTVQLTTFEYSSMSTRVFQYRIAGRSTPRSVYLAGVEAQMKIADTALATYEKAITQDEDRKVFGVLKRMWEEYKEAWYAHKQAIESSDPKTAYDLIEKYVAPPFYPRIRTAIIDVQNWNDKYAKKVKKEANQAVADATLRIEITFLLAILVGIGFCWLITKQITSPLRQIVPRLESLKQNCIAALSRGLRAVSNADLSVHVTSQTSPVETDQKDELGQIALTFNGMLAGIQEAMGSYNAAREGLSELVVGVRSGADLVAETSNTFAAASRESGAAATEIATGSERLAREASDAAATMRELASQVQTVGQSSRDQAQMILEAKSSLNEAGTAIEGVATSAENMTNIGTEGNRAVAETVQAMTSVRAQVEVAGSRVKELDEKGQQIGAIVQTIQGISEQTNLLALNAAIEAARAGEHGRGFGVVADEVRKLAEKASEASKEIASLIEGVRETLSRTVEAIEKTNSEVQVGSERSERAGTALSQIVTASGEVATKARSVAMLSQKVSQVVGDLSQLATEGSRAASAMASASDRVAESIQSVAAISEESSAGAHQLGASIVEVGSEAQRLNDMSASLQDMVKTFKIAEGPQKPDLRLAA